MELQTLVDLFSSFGVNGLIASAVILVLIYVAKRSGLVATSDQARLANVILAAVIYGLNDPSSESALMAVLSAVIASLAHVGLEKFPSLKPIISLKQFKG